MARVLANLPGTGRLPGALVAGIQLFNKDLARRLARFGRVVPLSGAERYLSFLTYFTESELGKQVLAPDVWSVVCREAPLIDRFPIDRREVDSMGDGVDQMMLFEVESVLFADYLKKVDIASSAHGLEVRTPMLDMEVFKVSRRLPIRDKVGLLTQKAALRRLVKQRISKSISRKAKQGFGLPFDRWSKGAVREWQRDLLLAKDARWRMWLREGVTESLLRDSDHTLPHGLSRYQGYQRTFMITSLEVWLRGLEGPTEIRR